MLSEEREKMIDDCINQLDNGRIRLTDCVEHIRKDLQQLEEKVDMVKHVSELFFINSTKAHPEKELNLSELNDSIQDTTKQLDLYFYRYRNYARIVENGFEQHKQKAREKLSE